MAKTDAIQIPDLTSSLEGSGFESKVIRREYAETHFTKADKQSAAPQPSNDHTEIDNHEQVQSSTENEAKNPVQQEVKPPTPEPIQPKPDVIEPYTPYSQPKPATVAANLFRNATPPPPPPPPPAPIDDDVRPFTIEEQNITTDSPVPPANQAMGNGMKSSSEFIFDNFAKVYPELISWVIEIKPKFIEDHGLPTELELEFVEQIVAHNKSQKKKLEINEFHRKNILEPLKEVLSKRGLEQSVSAEAQLAVAVLVLLGDTFIKIREIRAENKRLVEKLTYKMEFYLGKIQTEVMKSEEKLRNEYDKRFAEMEERFNKSKAA